MRATSPAEGEALYLRLLGTYSLVRREAFEEMLHTLQRLKKLEDPGMDSVLAVGRDRLEQSKEAELQNLGAEAGSAGLPRTADSDSGKLGILQKV